jgi:hypothetical protein
VRTTHIVFLPPSLDDVLSFLQRLKPVRVQALCPESSIERLAEGVVRGLAHITVAAIFLYVGLNKDHTGQWFLTEYNHVFEEGEQRVTFEQFKYNQELASRVWAAVSALALVIVFKKIE